MRILFCAAAMAALLSSQAMAAFDLQITEMFPGIESPGDENLTDDWFEVTNLGTTAWIAAVDGDLYFDDDSADPNKADLMSGVASIAPGESVIFVDGELPFNNLNTDTWHSLWDTPLTNAGFSIPQVGGYEGSGMGDDKVDGASIFIDPVGDGDPNDFSLLDAEVYPDPDEFPNNRGRSYDSDYGGFSTIGLLGVATAPNIDGIPQIGTPGYLVPEPSTVVIAILGLSALGLNHRRRS